MESNKRKSVGENKIRISDIIYQCLAHWRSIVVCMLVCAVVFGIVGYLKSVEYVNAQNEKNTQMVEGIDYEEQLVSLGLSDDEKKEAEGYAAILRGYYMSYRQQQDYMMNSIYINLDGNNVPTITLNYYIDNYYEVEYPIVDKTNNVGAIRLALYEALISDEVCEEIAKEINAEGKENYIAELIQLKGNTKEEDDNDVDIDLAGISLKLYGKDKESVEKMSLIIQDRLNKIIPAVKKAYGNFDVELASETYSVISDIDIIRLQKSAATDMLGMLNNIANLEEQMEPTMAEYVELRVKQLEEKADLKGNAEVKQGENIEHPQLQPSINYKYIILGLFLGAALVCAFVLLKVLYNDVLLNENDFELNYNYSVLGELCADTKKQDKWFAVIDKLIYRIWYGEKKELSFEDSIKLIAADIKLEMGEEDKMLIVTSREDRKDCREVKELMQLLAKENIKGILAKNICYNPEERLKVSECRDVILLEVFKESKYKDIERELEILEKYDKNILGCVALR